MPSIIKGAFVETYQPYPLMLLVAGVATSLLVLKLVLSYFLDPLKDVPGPAPARFTRLWLLREYVNGSHHRKNIELHEKYGPIVRIAPNQYSLSDPTAIRTIYGHGSSFLKSTWYTTWAVPEWANMFSVIDPIAHGMMRRKLSHAYSMSALVGYEPYVNECIKLLEQHLFEAAEKQATMNMFQWLRCYAFDVIGLITFSHRLGFLDRGQDEPGFMQALDNITPLSARMGVFPSLWPWFMRLGRLVGTSGPAGLDTITNYVENRIEEVKRKGPIAHSDGPIDFVQKLVANQSDKASGSAIFDQDIRIAAVGNMAAGSDTTSISLTSILYHLAKNPTIMAKLREEIKQAASDNRISNPITYKESQSLPYLQAVIKEGLRVHPATGFTLPRVVPEGGAVLAGQFFPAGAVVGINAWVAHANTEIWGSDARDFNPDRWLKEESAPADIYFLSFGQGSRTCIGKNISLLEINKLIPQLVRNFDFELDPKGKELDVQTHWFTFPKELPCHVFRLST